MTKRYNALFQNVRLYGLPYTDRTYCHSFVINQHQNKTKNDTLYEKF